MSQAPLTSWHFARPELAQHHLQAFDLGLISAAALHARRRMGKTEFLTQDLTPAAVERGLAVGYCNLWKAVEELREAIAAAGPARAVPGEGIYHNHQRMKAEFSSVLVSGTVGACGGGGAEL